MDGPGLDVFPRKPLRCYQAQGELSIHRVNGNILGLKTSQLRALERTYRRRVSPSDLVSVELARHLTSLSFELRRQVGVLVNREGNVRNVFVGDSRQLVIPEIGRLRGGTGRLRGLRLIHTHLGGEPLSHDDLNDLALLRLDAVAMVEVAPDGSPGRVEIAHVLPLDGPQGTEPAEPFRRIASPSLFSLNLDFAELVRNLEREFSRVTSGVRADSSRERALLVSLIKEDDHHAEMLDLVRSVGVELAGIVTQHRSAVDPRSVVGRGKLSEIVLEGMRRLADVAIFDLDLKPAQARNFEDATGLKAVDRTQLILDIFAQRARSRDGKLQVELAQLKYSLPRLTEKDAGLSRLVGGIGGRGPGETVLEIGRRRVRDRIRALERQVSRLAAERDLRRRQRERRGLPVLSIVGYTNAGKTTLLNALTKSRVEATDGLFVTLDPSSRRLRFPREGEVIITDTVGFVRNLPRELIAAFRATLEELNDADLLLHVVDGADPRLEKKIAIVGSVLAELGLGQIPQLLVVNKADLIPAERVRALVRRYGGVPVSAKNRTGLDQLVSTAEKTLQETRGRQQQFTGHSACQRGADHLPSQD